MHVSVCICTRNRGDGIVPTLRSLAASTWNDFDVVIVDQSEADDTARSICGAIPGDPRFQYYRSSSVGLSAARNDAVTHAQGPIVAFTDDDCVVPPDWLSLLVDYFRAFPRAGQVSGKVRAGEHDTNLGFVPAYGVSKLRQLTSRWVKWRGGGMGANMAFRLSVLQKVGPFDTLLGAGAPLHSWEDGDMSYRILRSGHTVVMAPDLCVIHNGFRTWEQGKSLVHGYAIGMGAGNMKHLRLGDVAIVPTLVHDGVRYVAWRRVFLLRRHSGIAGFLRYVLSAVTSFQYRIDRRSRTFIPRHEPLGAPRPAPMTSTRQARTAQSHD